MDLNIQKSPGAHLWVVLLMGRYDRFKYEGAQPLRVPLGEDSYL